MKLEDEIKQGKAFTNEYSKIVVNLIYTNSWIESLSKNFFSQYDMTTQQFNILRILRGQHPKPSTINMLRERMLDKMSDASRLVERLRIKGLLERIQSVKDNRAVDIFITEKGLKLLSEIDEAMPAFHERFTTLSSTEAETLNTLLDKLRG